MNNQQPQLTPRDVIENIRVEEYSLDDAAPQQERRRTQRLRGKLDEALRLLSEDLYSKETHFLLELIQNADDNEYPVGVAPSLALQVTPERLVFVNNEVGFQEEQVRVLCDVGKSTKRQKAGYIGEKGIGFKSVFTVSDAPEIHSNGFHFRFDRTDAENLLGYVVPSWCEPNPAASAGGTTIILPARRDRPFDPVALLKDIDARLLLFLAKLRRIEIHEAQRVTIHSREDQGDFCLLLTEMKVSEHEPEVTVRRFARASHPLDMTGTPDEKRPNITQTEIVLAFPLDAEHRAAPDPGTPVFAFLPIRPVGLPFAVQADFLLSASREDIHDKRLWNCRLRDGIADAVAAALSVFKRIRPLGLTYLDFLPAEGQVADPFFQPLREQILGRLRRMDALPSVSGTWCRPPLLCRADLVLRELIPSDELKQLFNADFLDNRFKADPRLLEHLGMERFAADDYVMLFDQHGDWFREQTRQWQARFFAHLAKKQKLPELVDAGLAHTPCVPTRNGELVAPVTVFFPLQADAEYGFEEELVILNGELLRLAGTDAPAVRKFLAGLGVKEPEPYHLINDHILPRHHNDCRQSSRKALIGHVRYIKDKWSEYLAGAKAAGSSVKVPMSYLQVATCEGDPEGPQYANAGRLFLSREYAPPFCLQSLLGAEAKAELLVSPDYLPREPDETVLHNWRRFFFDRGVQRAPKAIPTPDDYYSEIEECDFDEYFTGLLKHADDRVRKAILEALDESTKGCQCISTLTVRRKIGGKWREPETQFVQKLRAVIAPNRKKARVPLSEAFYRTPEVEAVFGEAPVYVDATLHSEQFRTACGLTWQVDAQACLKRLRQIKAGDGGDTAEQLKIIYRHLETRWSTESADIKDTFHKEPLIRIKGPQARWALPTEVAWRSTGAFLNAMFPALDTQYQDFHRFFVELLGVPEQVPVALQVGALARLAKEPAEKRGAIALDIYKRASRELEKLDPKAPEPAWLKEFRSQEVFVDQRGHLVPLGKNLFVDDRPEVGKLFSDDPTVSLVAVPAEELPRVKRLFDEVGVTGLSSVPPELVGAPDRAAAPPLTSLVRSMVPLVARLLYHERPAWFDRALSEGRFQRVAQVTISTALRVEVGFTLAGCRREAAWDLLPTEEERVILVRRDAPLIEDQLGEVVATWLGHPHLRDGIARLLMEPDADKAEAVLRLKRIGALPADAADQLTAALGGPALAPIADAEAGDDDRAGFGAEGEEDAQTSSTEHLVQEAAPAEGQDARPTPPAPSVAAPSPPAAAVRPPVDTTARSGSDGTEPGRPEATVSGAAKPIGAGAASTGVSGAHPAGGGAATQVPTGTTPPASASGRSGSRSSQPRATKSGRLLSYADAPVGDRGEPREEDPALAQERLRIAGAAVDCFLKTCSNRWQALEEMPHANPGFDVRAVAIDGEEERIEVKGQAGAWTQHGVVLTPTELAMAEEYRERYWLCVVEFALDDRQRRLHLIRDPYGKTDQFRFDCGWREAAEEITSAPLQPEAGLFVSIPGLGRGKIISVKRQGRFSKLHVHLESGRQVWKNFEPGKMTLWRE